MSRPSLGTYGIAGAVALGVAALVISIQPVSHDFGQIAVRGRSRAMTFRVTLPTGAGPADTIIAKIAGADADDFIIYSENSGTQCEGARPNSVPVNFLSYWRSGSCTYEVLFQPWSYVGPKVARLEVTGSRGGVAKATLTGTAVAPVCTNEVVFCNYAHLYSGTFNWINKNSSATSSHSENVVVTVTLGVAVCNGTVVDTENGQSTTGAVTGKGLIGVEFDEEVDQRTKTKQTVYRITAACPSPAFPATEYVAATPSRPAELGHFFQETLNQPIVSVGFDLVGSISLPSPETDQLNGVSGAIQINWSLKRS